MKLDEAEIDRRENFCLRLIHGAAPIVLEGYRIQQGRPVSLKGPQDYLTVTDRLVEDHIREAIEREFPEDGFLGEETGGEPGATLWVVDPIDGTANFARSIPHFCISISFVAEGEVQLGAIFNPATDECYLARKGRGATRNDIPIHVSMTDDIRSASFELGWSTRIANSRYLDSLGALLAAGANVRRASSGALGLAYVADGRSDGYAELHMNSWDCLAGLLLVREAGGVTGPFLSRNGLLDGAPVLAAAPVMAAALSQATGIPFSSDKDAIVGPTAVNF
jgi:myo-inositol-1(or 4)-monophosphatase